MTGHIQDIHPARRDPRPDRWPCAAHSLVAGLRSSVCARCSWKGECDSDGGEGADGADDEEGGAGVGGVEQEAAADVGDGGGDADGAIEIEPFPTWLAGRGSCIVSTPRRGKDPGLLAAQRDFPGPTRDIDDAAKI